MKVYVAGASAEIDRAERWMAELASAGIIVTSTWPTVIRAVGEANPKEATQEEYIQWTNKDLEEVNAAHVLWLLSPIGKGVTTTGAWVELGYAAAREKLIVASGPHKPIFTNALASFHSPNDSSVFEYLKRRAHAWDALQRI